MHRQPEKEHAVKLHGNEQRVQRGAPTRKGKKKNAKTAKAAALQGSEAEATSLEEWRKPPSPLGPPMSERMNEKVAGDKRTKARATNLHE